MHENQLIGALIGSTVVCTLAWSNVLMPDKPTSAPEPATYQRRADAPLMVKITPDATPPAPARAYLPPVTGNARYSAGAHQLAMLAICEAEGESLLGKLAVMGVTVNRLHSGKYGHTVKSVITFKRLRKGKWIYQYSCMSPDDKNYHRTFDRLAEGSDKISKLVPYAQAMLDGELDTITSADHYHAVYVRPTWADKMRRVKQIGGHIFYDSRKK